MLLPLPLLPLQPPSAPPPSLPLVQATGVRDSPAAAAALQAQQQQQQQAEAEVDLSEELQLLQVGGGALGAEGSGVAMGDCRVSQDASGSVV